MRKLLPLVVLSLMLTACGPQALTLSSFDGSKSVTIQVEVADSAKEREKGLMNRESLKPNTGMLFAFKEPQMLVFWMKNTKIPLEIIYFDAEGTFVNSLEMQPCVTDECEQYKSASLAKYALEVQPDFKKGNGVGVGWKLDLTQVEAMSDPT